MGVMGYPACLIAHDVRSFHPGQVLGTGESVTRRVTLTLTLTLTLALTLARRLQPDSAEVAEYLVRWKGYSEVSRTPNPNPNPDPNPNPGYAQSLPGRACG